MTLRRFTLASALLLAAMAKAEEPSGSLQLLQQTAGWKEDPCDAMAGTGPEDGLESKLFSWVRKQILVALNASEARGRSAQARVSQVLHSVEQESLRTNAAWTDENRFHGELQEMPPLLVVKVAFRMHGAFSAYAPVAAGTGNGPALWKEVGSGDVNDPRSWLTIYPLRRGQTGQARFLARFGSAACAGPMGVFYDVRQWDAEAREIFRIIQQTGALGLDQVAGPPTEKEPFPSVGSLQTEGAVLQLPYCWFSSLDTWDNPSLCALDAYLLSGDEVVFQHRTYSRPDLVPLAKALEYAAQHEFLAVRGYCDSDAVAWRMVRTPAPHADELRVVRHGPNAETVETESARFELHRRNGRWRVTDYSTD